MIDDLKQHAQSLSDALIDGDNAAAARHRDWLMGEVAAALLHQDTATLMDLRAAVSDLAPLADHYGDGKPGDRWRAVWEILYAISKTTRPQEQQRLARADTLSGQLLRLIGGSPGITPGEMGQATKKTPNHVSNTLRGLIDQGLVYRVPQGKTGRYFMTETGQELAGPAQAAPPVAVAPPVAAIKPRAVGVYDLDDARRKRMAKLGDATKSVPGTALFAGGGR